MGRTEDVEASTGCTEMRQLGCGRKGFKKRARDFVLAPRGIGG